jgi:tRNA(Arg) A34 adenosine deaminase TadA
MRDAFMVRAIGLSIENVRSGRGGPFGAVVVKDGEIIAEGTNSVVAANDPTAHAEMIAIREACKKLDRFQLDGCEIYTSCEPCPMCLGAIYWARATCIYFAGTSSDASNSGFDDAVIYREIAAPHADRKVRMIPLMREEALEAFRAWKEKADKISY